MDMPRFFRCSHCGNLVELLVASGVPMICCGEPMQELTANTTDAALEKHVPQVEVQSDVLTATVGSTLHPMLEAHHIAFIWLVTEQGVYCKKLDPTGEPVARFNLGGEKPLAVYEYCNLHGLWKKEL